MQVLTSNHITGFIQSKSYTPPLATGNDRTINRMVQQKISWLLINERQVNPPHEKFGARSPTHHIARSRSSMSLTVVACLPSAPHPRSAISALPVCMWQGSSPHLHRVAREEGTARTGSLTSVVDCHECQLPDCKHI